MSEKVVLLNNLRTEYITPLLKETRLKAVILSKCDKIDNACEYDPEILEIINNNGFFESNLDGARVNLYRKLINSTADSFQPVLNIADPFFIDEMDKVLTYQNPFSQYKLELFDATANTQVALLIKLI